MCKARGAGWAVWGSSGTLDQPPRLTTNSAAAAQPSTSQPGLPPTTAIMQQQQAKPCASSPPPRSRSRRRPTARPAPARRPAARRRQWCAPPPARTELHQNTSKWFELAPEGAASRRDAVALGCTAASRVAGQVQPPAPGVHLRQAEVQLVTARLVAALQHVQGEGGQGGVRAAPLQGAPAVQVAAGRGYENGGGAEGSTRQPGTAALCWRHATMLPQARAHGPAPAQAPLRKQTAAFPGCEEKRDSHMRAVMSSI